MSIIRILVVHDEIDLQEVIAEGLRLDGYAVDTCDNGLDAYEALFVEIYDLTILDLNLHDGIFKKVLLLFSALVILIISKKALNLSF